MGKTAKQKDEHKTKSQMVIKKHAKTMSNYNYYKKPYYSYYKPYKFKFYKDIKIIKWCKQCGTEWRPVRYSWQNKRSICTKCVAKEIAAWRKQNPDKWRDIVRRYKKRARSKRLPWVIHAYEQWKLWVAKNPDRRKEISRKSYYKRKLRV